MDSTNEIDEFKRILKSRFSEAEYEYLLSLFYSDKKNREEMDNEEKFTMLQVDSFNFSTLPDIADLIHEHNLFSLWIGIAFQVAYKLTYNEPVLPIVSNKYKGYDKTDLFASEEINNLSSFIIKTINEPYDINHFLKGYNLARKALENLNDPTIKSTNECLKLINNLTSAIPEENIAQNQVGKLRCLQIYIQNEGNSSINNKLENQIFVNTTPDKEAVHLKMYLSDELLIKIDEFKTNLQKSLNASLVHVQHIGLVEQMSAKHAMANLLNGSDLKDRLGNISLVIHGGAGSIVAIPPQLWQTVKFALFTAAATGVDSLSSHGNATQAAERAVQALEDCFLFNAGKGAVYDTEGTHELEASIMDGSSGKAGAIACTTKIKNPISAAKKIMNLCKHVFLHGQGAEKFCSDLPMVENKYFDTNIRWKQLQAIKDTLEKEAQHPQTVGAVVIDQEGRLAAATSTGGTANKMKGRIGDTSVIGAGTFADKNVAVSCTGHGESFLRKAVASRIAISYGLQNKPIDTLCKDIIDNDLQGINAGIIAVDHKGEIAVEANSKMFYGSFKNGILTGDITSLDDNPFLIKLF